MTRTKKRSSKLDGEKLKYPTTIRLSEAFEDILLNSVKLFGLSRATMARLFLQFALKEWDANGREKTFFSDF